MKQAAFILTALTALFFGPAHAAAAEDPYGYFLGNWNCTSKFGSTIQKTYAMSLQGSWMQLDNVFTFAHQSEHGEFKEFYRTDPRDGHWIVSSVGSNGELFIGASDGWQKETLQFDGTFTNGYQSLKQRERYMKRDAQSFDREHAFVQGAREQVFSSEHCTKAVSPL